MAEVITEEELSRALTNNPNFNFALGGALMMGLEVPTSAPFENPDVFMRIYAENGLPLTGEEETTSTLAQRFILTRDWIITLTCRSNPKTIHDLDLWGEKILRL
jgi:hypothetical protein